MASKYFNDQALLSSQILLALMVNYFDNTKGVLFHFNFFFKKKKKYFECGHYAKIASDTSAISLRQKKNFYALL